MSEQEQNQDQGAKPGLQMVSVTHEASMAIGDDGRAVIVKRLADGGYHFEWIKPDPGNGAANIGTRISLSQEALEATLECLFGIDNSIQKQNAEGQLASAVQSEVNDAPEQEVHQ
jgi:hypothetical protein